MSKTTIINIKVDEQEKQEAQKLAKKLGFSLSSVMKAYLKDFLRKKRIDVSLDDVEPELTDWAKEQLQKSEEDVKAGRVLMFKDADEEMRYLDKLVEDEEESRKN
jgi:addiction module RelB/DinJ family antitoxin